MKLTKKISAYQAEIGKTGGSTSSPAKRRAARIAARKRRGHTDSHVLPVNEWLDQVWYSGKGRNANIGLWDEKRGCFWVIGMSDKIDPEKFPASGARSVRLKREGHKEAGGTFWPKKELG